MANLLTRLSTAIDAFRAGLSGKWLPPGEPMKPVAPAETKPRQFDYPVGYNLRTAPRSEEALSFAQLRALADNYDLLRLAIETRKDQVEAQYWDIIPLDTKDTNQKSNINAVKKFLKRPDRKKPFGRWLRTLLEDVLVIDAPAIYIRRTRGGQVYSFELVDGATIKPVIDETGRTPDPPYPAYQQIISGMPAIELKADELLYIPRNPRTHKVYGLGNVEQVIMTVNIALRRQLYQLGYYTEGNVPEAFVACPAEWGVQQISEFQDYFDMLFELNPNLRRKVRFVPHGSQPVFSKDNPLKDEYDEWLARVIAYCFSLPPTPLVKETNRATAETTQNAGKAEGLAPIKNYIKELMDILIQDYLGYEDVQFAWIEQDSQKPLEQAQINEIYLRNNVLTQNEVREDLGRHPLIDEQKAAMRPQQSGLAADDGQDASGETLRKASGGKAEGKKKDFEPLTLDTLELQAYEKQLYKAILGGFNKIKPDFCDQIAVIYEQISDEAQKLDDYQKKLLNMVLDEIEFDGWGVLFDQVETILGEIAKHGAYRALAQIGINDKDIVKIANANAVKWAQARSAEMVGMKYIDGKLVLNPNAKWVITDSTRTFLQNTIKQALEEGWSARRLAKAIQADPSIWDERAENIARTELALAHNNGNLIGWQASGVVEGKRSIRASGEKYEGLNDLCQDNADAGVIPLTANFPSGHKCAPYHARCKCAVIPVVDKAVKKFDSGKHHRGKDGRFQSKQGSMFNVKKDVQLKGKQPAVLEKGTTVYDVKPIASGRKIRQVDGLVNDYPLGSGKKTRPENWAKMRGTANVKTLDGQRKKAEIHWYQCKNVGKIEMKVKRFLTD